MHAQPPGPLDRSAVVDVQAERAARNEDLFRSVNERIEDVVAQHPEQWFDAVCECSDLECAQNFRVEVAEYEQIRTCSGCFAMLEGHEDPRYERVIERKEGFVVAEKTGDGAKVARALDPRA